MPDGLVLVVEHSLDVAALYRRMLEDEGFVVESAVGPLDVVREVRRHQPQLVVLDVLPHGEQALATLDRLREDDVARDVPVVVTTTSQQIADAALASYNVRAALVKPLDLAEFLETVAREVGRPTMHASIPEEEEPPGDFARYAEQVLARRSRHIVFGWIQRLRREPPWSERDDLGLADLIDHAPVLLKALDVRLHYDAPAAFFERHPEAVERAQHHARLRMRQGMAFGATLREYALLREEIWSALRARRPASAEPDEILDVERAINGTLDTLIAAAAAAVAEGPLSPGTTEPPAPSDS